MGGGVSEYFDTPLEDPVDFKVNTGYWLPVRQL